MSKSKMSIISVKGVFKNYGNIKAVNGIDLNVEAGEMFGLVGPDGAGKTTMIKILCGLLIPGSGEINLLGFDPISGRKKIHDKIGYLSQKFSLYEDLSIDENIEFFASIHGVKDYKKRRDELLEYTRLINFRERIAGKLSGGMKQKLALACSLIHRPEIIFLDEPTTGVDPVSRRDFWKILSGLQKEGITIFMTTPYLDEAERCTKVALMSEGEIIINNSPIFIKKSINKTLIEFTTSASRKAYKLIKDKLNFEVQMFGERLNVLVQDEADIEKIKKALTPDNIEIQGIRFNLPSLENVFIYLVEKKYKNKTMVKAN
jgi:ABC-2 type transport system ATP-binding protein